MSRRLLEAVKGNPELVARLLMVAEQDSQPSPVTCPSEAARIVAPLLAGHEVERLAVVALDRRRRVVDADVVSIGNDGACIVCPRAILRWVLTRSRPCSGFILAHNHPSGDPTPSRQDEDVTDRVAAAARTLGLPLLDHLVIAGPSRWVSMAGLGMVPQHREPLAYTT